MINRKNWKQQKKNKKNKGKWLSGSALMCEMLGTHHFHLYNKKKLKQLKLNDLSWTHQRIEFAEKIGSHKSIEIGESREYSEICLPGAEANEVINLNNNFDKLLEAECEGHSLWRGPYLFIIISGNSTRFSWWRAKKNPYMALAGVGMEWTLWNMPRVFAITKPILQGKRLCQSLSHLV